MYVGTHARERPDAPAQIMASTGPIDGDVTTYRELDERSNRFAQLMHAQGLRVADHYAVFLENHPRFLEVCWAGDRSGLYFTTVNSYLTAGEVAHIVNDCGARVVVSSSAAARRRRAAARVVPARRAVPDARRPRRQCAGRRGRRRLGALRGRRRGVTPPRRCPAP